MLHSVGWFVTDVSDQCVPGRQKVGHLQILLVAQKIGNKLTYAAEQSRIKGLIYNRSLVI
jgi:hypothetical protein